MLSIKKASTADIELIREITKHTWAKTYIPILGIKQVEYMLELFYHPDALREQIETQKHTFLICFDEDRAVAFASFSKTGPGKYKLHKLYILPDLQGKGIGRFIVNHVVTELKTQNGQMLMLNVNRYNTQAINFYNKYGFKMVKEEDIDIGNGYFMNDYVLGFNIPE